MKIELLTLRIIHILGAIVWVGSLTFISLFLIPAVRSSPAVAGQVMAGLEKRRLFNVLPIVALFTIASGLRLLAIDSAGFSGGYFSTPTGRTFGAGALVAIIAFLITLLISRPGFLRAGRLGVSLATTTDEAAKQRITAEMQRLSQRVMIANAVVVVLLLLTAVGMATARYL